MHRLRGAACRSVRLQEGQVRPTTSTSGCRTASPSSCRSLQAVPPVALIDPESSASSSRLGQVQEDLRGGLWRAEKPSTSTRRRQVETIPGRRRDHRRHRLPDVRSANACRHYGYGHLPERLHLAGSRAARERVRARPNGEIVLLRERQGAHAPSGSSTASGSRDENTNRHGARKVCCMYSLKLAHLIREHTDAEVWEFYIDMRTPGEGLRGVLQPGRQTRGSHMVRGKVASVYQPSHDGPGPGADLDVEDTLAGNRPANPASTWSMLSVGLESQEPTPTPFDGRSTSRARVRRLLQGTPSQARSRGALSRTGVFLAGCCQATASDIPGHGGPGWSRCRARCSRLIDRGIRGTGTEHGSRSIEEDRCSGCKYLPVRSCPYHGHHSPGRRYRQGLHQRGACARAVASAWLRALPDAIIGRTCSRTIGDLRGDRGGVGICLSKPIRRSRRAQAESTSQTSAEDSSPESWRCSATGARTWRPDLAGTSRMRYAPNVRVVRVMCSGRIDPQFVMHAFARGADGVLIGGCHPGDCHYQEGNYEALRRFTLVAGE